MRRFTTGEAITNEEQFGLVSQWDTNRMPKYIAEAMMATQEQRNCFAGHKLEQRNTAAKFDELVYVHMSS